jgi:hypothetical protein
MSTQSKVTLADELRMLESGIKANPNDFQNVGVGGTTFDLNGLIQHLDAFLAVLDAATKAKTDWHTAVTNQKASGSAARVFREQIRGLCIALYGKTSAKLGEFGFVPAKAKKTTAAIKALAVLKLKATRKARHTMGKKQKLSIKGTVPVTEPPVENPPPVAAPPAPVPVPAPPEPAAPPVAVTPAPLVLPAPAVSPTPVAGGHAPAAPAPNPSPSNAAGSPPVTGNAS